MFPQLHTELASCVSVGWVFTQKQSPLYLRWEHVREKGSMCLWCKMTVETRCLAVARPITENTSTICCVFITQLRQEGEIRRKAERKREPLEEWGNMGRRRDDVRIKKWHWRERSAGVLSKRRIKDRIIQGCKHKFSKIVLFSSFGLLSQMFFLSSI